MTGYSRSPRLAKAGLVLIDPGSGTIARLISMQYNAETLSRSLAVQAVGDNGDRSQALRIKGPAVETFSFEATLDATDQLELPDRNPAATDAGLLPQIAALESLIQPSADQLRQQDQLAALGTLEIAPMETPLALFIWSRHRIVPVRVTELSITEEAFDPALNPIRAKVSLALRALSVDDLGFKHRGGSLFMSYLSAKEQLARRAPSATLASFGLERLP
jgi:Contractile injection system tube protein